MRTHAVALGAARTPHEPGRFPFVLASQDALPCPRLPLFAPSSPRLRPGGSPPPRKHTAPGLAPAPPPPRGPSPALPREKGGRGVAPRAQRRPGSAGSWGRRAGLGPAPCLFSLRPLNARLRRKDYPRRIMPGVNTRANKSACTTPPTPLGPGPRAGGRERAPRC